MALDVKTLRTLAQKAAQTEGDCFAALSPEDILALLDRLERAETVVEMACAVMGEGDYGAATELERQLLASIQRWREAAKP
jgi:hypothetical protein